MRDLSIESSKPEKPESVEDDHPNGAFEADRIAAWGPRSGNERAKEAKSDATPENAEKEARSLRSSHITHALDITFACLDATETGLKLRGIRQSNPESLAYEFSQGLTEGETFDDDGEAFMATIGMPGDQTVAYLDGYYLGQRLAASGVDESVNPLLISIFKKSLGNG